MKVGIGILPCDGGASQIARQTGSGRALDVILRARDFDAGEAEPLGAINTALDRADFGEYPGTLAQNIAQLPAESINA